MDVTISCKLVRHLSAAAILALVGLPATWAKADGSTAVFVTDNPQPAASSAQPSARGALSFVQPTRVEPVAKPTRTASAPATHAVRVVPIKKVQAAPQQAAPAKKQSLPGPAQRELTVASNQQRKQPLQATAPQNAPKKSRPAPLQFVERAVHNAPASQRQPVRRVNHEAQKPAPQKVDPIAKLLIEAHEMSQQASSVEDYTVIIEKCSEALKLGARDDKKTFSRQLTSWSLNRRGQMRLDSGEQIAANSDFQAAIDFNANNWRAVHNRGVSHAQSGELAEAFDDFNNVVELNPQYAKAYSNRATLFVQANDLQSALEDYRKAGSLDPNLAAAHVGQGRVCHIMGRWDEAIEHFSKAVQVEPTNADIICSRGDLHADMGHYSDALADYARTIELNPEFGHAYRNGAWLLATCPNSQFRDPDNALLGARQALEVGYGEKHVALDTLAAALANAGEFQQAVETITQAIDLAPEKAKFAYLTRMQMYQDRQPFRTEPVGDVAQVVYEATDK